MCRLVRFVTVFAIVVTVPALSAQNQGGQRIVLTVDQAVNLALENNLGLLVEGRKLETARRNSDYAWNRFLPTVNVGATLSRLNEVQKITTFVPIPTPPFLSTTTVEPDPWNLSLSFQIQLPLNPALFSGIRQLLIEYEGGLISYQAARRRLERDIRKLFYQILAAEEAVRITQLRAENARQRFQLAESSYRAGRAPELTMLQARVAWENTRPALREQELAVESLKNQFKLLLGLPLENEIVLEGSIQRLGPDLTPEDQVAERFVDQRLDVLQLENTLKAVENALRVQYDSLWPTLVLMWSADPSLPEPWKTQSWEDNKWRQRSGMLAFTLSFKLDNLIPGSQTWVSIRNLEDQIGQVRLNLEQLRRAAALEIRSTLARLRKIQESLAALEANVELAARVAQLTETGYRTGTQSLTEVQEADLQLQAARLQLLNEKLAYNNLLIDLVFALQEGEVLSEGALP